MLLRVTAKEHWLFVAAVLYRERAGIAWRDLLERLGDFKVSHTRHTAGEEQVFGKGFSQLTKLREKDLLAAFSKCDRLSP